MLYFRYVYQYTSQVCDKCRHLGNSTELQEHHSIGNSDTNKNIDTDVAMLYCKDGAWPSCTRQVLAKLPAPLSPGKVQSLGTCAIVPPRNLPTKPCPRPARSPPFPLKLHTPPRPSTPTLYPFPPSVTSHWLVVSQAEPLLQGGCSWPASPSFSLTPA